MTIDNAVTNDNPLLDTEFIRKFEDQTLDLKYFDHEGHLRLAWIYLTQYPYDKALSLICQGIKRFAEHLGATTKFNLTLTDAFVRIMAQRLKQGDWDSWQAFVQANQNLCDGSLGPLLNYFSKERLFSDKARLTLIAPDLKPFED